MKFGILLIIGLAIVLLIAGEGFLRRGKKRPLAHRFARPRAVRVTLGAEATDTAAFDAAMRRNGPMGKMPPHPFDWRNSGGDGLMHEVAPLPEDESYAARFHAAFGKDKETMK